MTSEYDINTYRELASNAIEDLKNYANDGNGARLIASYIGYTEDLERIDNTRAVPDVPELVRYRYDPWTNHGSAASLMAINPNGEYVRYDQAAEVIAEWATLVTDQATIIEGLRNRAETAEAELAKIKHQKPVGYLLRGHLDGNIFRSEPLSSVEKSWGFTEIPLYAAPVAIVTGPDSICEVDEKRFSVEYTNYKGETSRRDITPKRLWYGATYYHPQCQFILTAYDHDKQADRDFALTDFWPYAGSGADKTIERFREALQSISINTCCVGCREASLVAIAALEESKP